MKRLARFQDAARPEHGRPDAVTYKDALQNDPDAHLRTRGFAPCVLLRSGETDPAAARLCPRT